MKASLLQKLALGLYKPVIALTLRNPRAGNYSNDKGSTALDSLKKSGDLEYAADTVLGLDHRVGYFQPANMQDWTPKP